MLSCTAEGAMANLLEQNQQRKIRQKLDSLEGWEKGKRRGGGRPLSHRISLASTADATDLNGLDRLLSFDLPPPQLCHYPPNRAGPLL
jgi:hypothetical protein